MHINNGLGNNNSFVKFAKFSIGGNVSPMNTPLHNLRLTEEASGLQSPQKPVNLLPEISSSSARKLTDREQRDCEVIGMC